MESLEHAKAGRRMRTILAVQRALKRWCESRDAMPAVASLEAMCALRGKGVLWAEKPRRRLSARDAWRGERGCAR